MRKEEERKKKIRLGKWELKKEQERQEQVKKVKEMKGIRSLRKSLDKYFPEDGTRTQKELQEMLINEKPPRVYESPYKLLNSPKK